MHPESDILKILTLRKIGTCRKYKIPAGSQVQLMTGFKVFAIVEITAVEYIEDISKINHERVKNLGFKTRKEYLKQPYNVNNESKERYYHEFKVIESKINEYIGAWKHESI